MSWFTRHEPCPKCQEVGNDRRGNNLAVYSDGGAHCFACGHHISANIFSKQETKQDGPKSLYPVDFIKEIPRQGWKWLLQYGLAFSYWREHVGWSPIHSRLIFKVGNPLAFSIGRYIPLGDADPNNFPKWRTWGNSHKHTEVISSFDCRGCTVLTEDLISAHKVGQVAKAVPIFGTRVHPCHLDYLGTTEGRIVLWLDKGQEEHIRKEALRMESIINRPVETMITFDDPKDLTFNHIKGILNVQPIDKPVEICQTISPRPAVGLYIMFSCKRCRYWSMYCFEDEECMYHVTNTDNKIDFPKREESKPLTVKELIQALEATGSPDDIVYIPYAEGYHPVAVYKRGKNVAGEGMVDIVLEDFVTGD